MNQQPSDFELQQLKKDIATAGKTLVKQFLIHKLLEDPLLSPIHKIELEKYLDKLTPIDSVTQKLGVEDKELRKISDNVISEALREIDNLLPKNFHHALVPEIEDAIQEISTDLLKAGNHVRRLRMSFFVDASIALRKINETERAYYNIDTSEAEQQHKALLELSSTILSLFEWVKEGKTSVDEAHKSLNSLITDNLLYTKQVPKLIEAQEKEKDARYSTEVFLDKVKKYERYIESLSNKWRQMLPLAEENTYEAQLIQLNPKKAKKLMQKELKRREDFKKRFQKKAVKRGLQVFKRQVKIQEQEAQRWQALQELRSFIKDNPKALKALDEIMKTIS